MSIITPSWSGPDYNWPGARLSPTTGKTHRSLRIRAGDWPTGDAGGQVTVRRGFDDDQSRTKPRSHHSIISPQPAHRSMRNDGGTRFFASYSALAPENLITLAHLSVSSAMRIVYSLGDSASISPPSSAMRVLIVGSARTALISRLSVSMISAGVFFGAPIPAHALVSKPGTKSPSGGTSGSASRRVVAVTANGRSLPALMCSMEEGILSNMTCTCPAMRSVSASDAPR